MARIGLNAVHIRYVLRNALVKQTLWKGGRLKGAKKVSFNRRLSTSNLVSPERKLNCALYVSSRSIVHSIFKYRPELLLRCTYLKERLRVCTRTATSITS